MGTSRFIATAIVTAMVVIGLVGSESVIAGGFAILEQGVKGLGNAFAGSAAVAEGAETLFFNPAGMTRLRGGEIEAAGYLILPSLDFEDRGSRLNRAVGGAPISFTEDGDGADLTLIPNLYSVHSVDDRLKLGGEADFTVPVPAFAAATGAFRDTGASAILDLPDSVSLSAYQEINDRLAVLGDLTWTHWSRFDEVVVRFDNPRQPPVVTPQGFEDVFRYALGLSYHPQGPVILRTGLAYDETPIPNARLRSPRIPDQDRVWLTFGASYRYSEAVSLDFAYAHLFIDDAGIDNTEVITGHVLRGDFEGEIDIIAAQLVWHRH